MGGGDLTLLGPFSSAICVTNLPRPSCWKWGHAASQGSAAPSAAPPGTSPSGCIEFGSERLVLAGAPVPPHGLSLSVIQRLPWGAILGMCPGAEAEPV